jgi:hypothetical protein
MVHDVTVVHAGTTTDRYGNTVKDWTTASSSSTRGWVSRSSTVELTDGGREGQMSGWIAYLPVDTVVAGGDRVTWNGVTFEVDGPPNQAWTPRGPHHIEAQLRVVEG